MMCTTFSLFFFLPIFFTFNQKSRVCVCVCVCVVVVVVVAKQICYFCKVVWEWQIKRHLAMVQPSRITFAAQSFWKASIYLSIYLLGVFLTQLVSINPLLPLTSV